eukprot:scaffold52462_cov71-Phaeocystis_antarctica.AAC.9
MLCCCRARDTEQQELQHELPPSVLQHLLLQTWGATQRYWIGVGSIHPSTVYVCSGLQTL